MLHPYFEERLRAAQDVVDSAGTPDEIHHALTATPSTWAVPDDVTLETVEIPGRHGPIVARIYRSAALTHDSEHPTIMVMHGGGFQYGDMDMGEAHGLAAELAHRTGAVALTMNYRLASDTVRHPIPLDDVVSSWEWLLDSYPRTGRAYIGGGSAGASLAIAAAQRLRDEGGQVPDGMLLAYGVYHFPVPGPSLEQRRALEELPTMMRANPDDMLRVFRLYAGRITNLPRYTAPGNIDLTGLPPAAVVTSEYDELAPSSTLLVAQLAESGVPVVHRLAEGMLHGHLNWFPTDVIPEIDASIGFFADFIRTDIAAHVE